MIISPFRSRFSGCCHDSLMDVELMPAPEKFRGAPPGTVAKENKQKHALVNRQQGLTWWRKNYAVPLLPDQPNLKPHDNMAYTHLIFCS